MRKIFTICLSALVVPCVAQNSTVFQDNMNVIYQHVDRSYVTTGLLLDYGLLLSDVAKFDGTLQSSNYLNRPLWSMLYTLLVFMQFNDNTSLSAPNTVNTQINNPTLPIEFNGQVLSKSLFNTVDR